MLHYGSRPRVTTTTTTTEDSATPSSERRVLRLTLLAGNGGKKEGKTADTVSLKFLTVTFHNKAHRGLLSPCSSLTALLWHALSEVNLGQRAERSSRCHTSTLICRHAVFPPSHLLEFTSPPIGAPSAFLNAAASSVDEVVMKCEALRRPRDNTGVFVLGPPHSYLCETVASFSNYFKFVQPLCFHGFVFDHKLDYVSRLAWERLGIPPEELVEVAGEREVWAALLKLLPPHKRKKMDGWMDAEAENPIKETWKKKNGLIHRERPAGMESPQQHLRDATNGAPTTSPQHHGPRVYGVVQRTSADKRQELMAREWTVDHLHDEMKYIREVRDSLEKVRERMYGQFGGMQQSMEKLSREIRAANAHRKTLESEVKVRTTAMENFDQMNSSLISANISLQKSLLENCQNRVDMKDEVKSLRSTYEKTQEKLRDKERELAAAQAENQTLRLQVESSQETNTRAVQDLTAKLQREYEEKLQREQQKHREEIENLQAQLDEYIRRLEEAERNLRTAEAKITERDQRIVEVERLLSCMGMEKSQLQQKLQECEQRIRLLELTDQTDAAEAKKSKQLQEEAVELRERIKHLNDMVFCQQRKVKGMIEEVESLRARVAQKDMFISELLDRIAIVECENNELEDKLKYFMSTQNRPQEILERRDVGVGCDLLPRHEVQRHDVESVHLHSTPPTSPVQPSSPVNATSPTQPLSPTEPSSPTSWAPSSSRPSYLSSLQYPSFRLTTPIQPRTYSSTNPPPSRLETSLLKYSPGQYSQYLQSSNPAMNGVSSESDPVVSPVPSGRDEVDAEPETDSATQTKPQAVTSSTSSSRPRSRLQVSSPFMKLIGHNLKDKH
ncbi:hypothetical protein CCH79_00010422 [Gambusia affinis]|uniref:Myocardial zonula adherens protein n=1 Tax=Gambusia affinis TaxID=33528 RepID=A0A315V2F6_GAMAF|nr:hypothetical protein CCH79_00010422 [Gambusia affinis]